MTVVQLLSHVQHFVTPWTIACRLLCPSLSPRVCSDSCPLSRWCCPTILSSVAPFSFCCQSFPASGSFPMNQLFAPGGQSIKGSASASVLPMDIQGWFPFGWTGWISLLFKGLSRVFCATVQKHQFFSTQSSLWSNSYSRTWLYWKNHSFDYGDLCQQMMSLFFNTLSRFGIVFLLRSKRLHDTLT